MSGLWKRVPMRWSSAANTLRGLAYVTFQELATRFAHRNTGKYSQDPVADRIMLRISQDENLHALFYRDILGAAIKIQPSNAVRAITAEVLAFDMPGTNIPGYLRKAMQMARAGIFDLRIHHDDVLWPILRHWGIFELEGLDAEAEAAWQAGDYAGAEARFRQIVALSPGSRAADLSYGDLFTLARQRSGPEQEKALWREYLAAFPRGRYADDARAGLCRRGEPDERPACWQQYLTDFPAGVHRSQASRALDEP